MAGRVMRSLRMWPSSMWAHNKFEAIIFIDRDTDPDGIVTFRPKTETHGWHLILVAFQTK